MFPMFNGFAFWMVNPIYVTVPVACVVKAVRRRWDATDTLLALAVILEIFLLLLHKTLGGWQFGARYLCDPIPMMMLLELRGRKSHARWETALERSRLRLTSTARSCSSDGSVVSELPACEKSSR